jgi:hypothetical protein
MALLKSKVNQEDRNKLFYSKFKYRSAITAKYLNFIYYTWSIEEFKEKIEIQARRTSSFGRKINTNECDYDLIEKIIKFRKKHRNNKDCIIRVEYDKICVFSNNVKILNQVYAIDNNAVLTEAVNPCQPGVLLFARQPEYKFRSYIKSKKITTEYKENFLYFLNQHGSLRPCGALTSRLLTHYSRGSEYIGYGTYFIDYNDESMVTYLTLMFPEILGKTYKLEKRTG